MKLARQEDRRRHRPSCCIFIVVTTLATALLAITIGNVSFGSTKAYKAVFTDATGVVKGDDVRIAGVKVGSVKGVEIVDRDPGAGRRSTSPTTPRSPSSTYATIRYRNLVGQRYIALTEGTGGAGVAARRAPRSRWRGPRRPWT